jgi:phosphatidylserine/phosphatidylglycerophosphate/cardiolipin synthase-like enzyme
MLFQPGSETALTAGPSAEIDVVLMPQQPSSFQLGFTRGYISSQAYAEQFHNGPIEPSPPTFNFDTSPYQAQYRWLGFHARRLMFDFVAETVADQGLSLDVFAYDFDEPDIIRQLGQLGPRLRLYLDNSASHIGDTAREPKAHDWLTTQGAQVKVGHFQRFSHDKVLIQKRGDTALKVLSGSANFSVRGLYVQSNNVFTFDDPATAALYEQAFQQSWDSPSGFATSQLAASWHDCGGHDGLPRYSICFSPHHNASVSLDRVASAVTGATSSVLFAIMEVGTGSGVLLDAIRALPSRPELYAFGTTQRLDGSLNVQKSGNASDATFIPFSYLSKQVPAPFRAEWDGGVGQVIHHKFVVTDFNGDNPLVFAGSSNLAAGGEEQNGDNLVCFADRDIATKFAIEAIQLVDHYRFRAAMQQATDAQPLQLQTHSAHWASAYYIPGSPKFRERTLLAGH